VSGETWHSGAGMMWTQPQLPLEPAVDAPAAPMRLAIEFDLNRVDIYGVRRQLLRWEDSDRYGADVRRLLWSIDAAMRLRGL